MLLSAPPSSPPSKWRVSPSQKATLLSAFSHSAYPSPARKAALALQLGVTSAQVSKWFQHRREALARLGQFKAQYNRPRRTPEELDVLQTAFAADRYPNAQKLAELERRLENVSAKQIKLWFKHRRRQLHKRSRNTATTVSSSQHTATPTLTPAVTQQPPPHVPLHPHAHDWWRGRLALNPLEEMALRGAWAAVGAEMLPHDAAARLAAVVGKPVEVVLAWWSAELTPTVVDEQRDVQEQYPSYLYAANQNSTHQAQVQQVRYQPWAIAPVQQNTQMQSQHVLQQQPAPQQAQVGMYGKG